MWQDFVMGGVGTLFGIALIPEVYRGFKQKIQHMSKYTTVTTAVGIYVLAYAEYTLGMVYAPLLSSLTATLWVLIFVQSIIYKNYRTRKIKNDSR